jgi:hypothetical protein
MLAAALPAVNLGLLWHSPRSWRSRRDSRLWLGKNHGVRLKEQVLHMNDHTARLVRSSQLSPGHGE